MDNQSGGERDFEDLEVRLKTILPELYQEQYEGLLPISMGSASLKYSSDGEVAWGEVWESFCDLAVAGGPPHKGTLLEPASKDAIGAEPEQYSKVVGEICRGLRLVTGFHAEPSPVAGWVRLICASEDTAQWLSRAIVTENVSVSFRGLGLYLPASPYYRIEKEIKNVITVAAKTSHYWFGHIPLQQRWKIRRLFSEMESQNPVVQPGYFLPGIDGKNQRNLAQSIATAIFQKSGLRAVDHPYAWWLGLQCGTARAAIWMMRILIVSNVFARREESVLFVPVNPSTDASGEIVVGAVLRAHQFAVARQVL